MRTGRRATDAQVKELRKALQRGASLAQAAMRADMDRKTARKYRDPPELPSQRRTPRTWRTRADPLAAVWPQLAELLQREPALQARTLLAWLQRERPGQPWERSRRTLERRVRQWRAQHGPAKEVFFAQVHEPGRLGASDFSHLDALGVTIQGQPFAHLVDHFVLTYSNWEPVSVCFAESFASLSEGLQNALGELGGVPLRHRTDRMTLAVHHEGSAEQYTARYRALLAHSGLEAEATNPASGHENGDAGKMVAAGTTTIAGKGEFMLARYLPSRPEIGSFAASPDPVPSGSSVTLTAANITAGNANSTITQVTFSMFDSSGNKVVLGTGTQSSPGTWTFSYTVRLPPGSYTLNAQAQDSYGVLGDPVAAALTVQ
jgi:hypothetical protein